MTGNAKYAKLRVNEFADSGQPLQKAAVNLDDVTLCLPKVHSYAASLSCGTGRHVLVGPENFGYLLIAGWI